MKLFISTIFILIIGLTPAFAEQIIFSEGIEYEIAEITEERKYRLSHISKVQGLTTTGEMFFIFTSEKTNFEKVMFLDREGQWAKAELRDIIVEELESVNSIVTKQSIPIHFLLDQHERVYNKQDYKFFVKTFDKSIYAGNNFDNFQGKIDGVTVFAIITDPNGDVKADFSGMTENGIYEGSVNVTENLWQRGWYTVDLVVEHDGQPYFEQLTFYVYGQTVPSGSSNP